MRVVFVCTSTIVLALTVVAPGNSAPGEQDGAAPAAERRGPCQTINLGGVKIFYKSRMSCEKAKHYARRLYKTGGRDEPRNFTCESGTNYETGANCYHDRVGARRFGWHPADKLSAKANKPVVLCRSYDSSGYVDIPKVAPSKCIMFKRGGESSADGVANAYSVRWQWGNGRAKGKGKLGISTVGKVPARFRLTKVVQSCDGRPTFSKLNVRYRFPEDRGSYSYHLNTCP